MPHMLPGVQAVTMGGKAATAAGESGQMMTGNGSVHEVVHGDPRTQDGADVAYPLGCRQQVSKIDTTKALVQALLYSFGGCVDILCKVR